MRFYFLNVILGFLIISFQTVKGQINYEIVDFKPFVWTSQVPGDCPFEPSIEITGIKFLGRKAGWQFGDTWYPSWASDNKMYSPWTDGKCVRLDGGWESSNSGNGAYATTGHAVLEGESPLTLKINSLGTQTASAVPYQGRYPSGSLVYNGVWFYGTYCLSPSGQTTYGDQVLNWPWMGPFVGFRYSTDYGRTWHDDPHSPEKPLFGESGINGYPIKIGAPHFVDFGKNMEFSPDGKAYLVAHGSDVSDKNWRFWNTSWITGDQVYPVRVSPDIEKINTLSEYEFFAGYDMRGNPVWTSDFTQIKPMLEWNNNMGCVTMTYNAPISKYILCITDGGNTCSKMNTYLLESDNVTGPWKLIVYMKDFGEQAYFVNIPSKFISRDGKTFWILYSANFASDWNGIQIKENPPGSHYGMVFQEVQLIMPYKK